MEEKRLYNAAAKGDEEALHELLQEDPLVLDRVSYTSPNKTPLHIATIKGYLPFVEQILNHNPHLAEELDSQQSSALHIASAKGYVEIVKKLLLAVPNMCLSRDSQGRIPLHLVAIEGHVQVLEELLEKAPSAARAPNMCLSRDSQGRTPLHLAVIEGHVQVLEELLEKAPFAAREKMNRGLSLLHLCVKYSQFEALKILVAKMNELLNSKDDNGDTILHMAVRDRQIEAINFLLTMAELEVNAVNLNGMTTLDVLMQSRRDSRDSEIEESLKRAGAFGAYGTNIPLRNNQNMQKDSWKRLFKHQYEWLEKKKSALMVAASLIATMAFQVGVNPPAGVWQEDKSFDPQENPVSESHKAGSSIMAYKNPKLYARLYIVNTISFLSSLSIILLLMSGLPIRRRFFMWILMVITWIAITTIAYTYLLSISLLTPLENVQAVLYVLGYSILGWIGMMALLLIVHTIRLIIKLVKKLRRILMTRQRRMVAGSAVLVNNVGV